MTREVYRPCEGCGKRAWRPPGVVCCNEACEKAAIERAGARPLHESFSVHGDWKPYVSENMGHEPVVIRSKAHWREVMKRNNIVNKEYGTDNDKGAYKIR